MSLCCCQWQGFRHFNAAFQFGPLTKGPLTKINLSILFLLLIRDYLFKLSSRLLFLFSRCAWEGNFPALGGNKCGSGRRLLEGGDWWRGDTGENSGNIQELGKSQRIWPRILFFCVCVCVIFHGYPDFTVWIIDFHGVCIMVKRHSEEQF